MREEDSSKRSVLSDFIVVKALENGVSVIGLTRGQETKFAHSEKLDSGEVWIAQFTEFTSAMKIRGRAMVMTAHGSVESGKRNDETG